MSQTQTKELAPIFEAVCMPHKAIMPALNQIQEKTMLSAEAARQILFDPQRFDYKHLKQPNGLDFLEHGAKRYYAFIDEEYFDAAKPCAVMVECAVQMQSGVKFVYPQILWREIPFVLSARFACCSNSARTMIYSDDTPQGGAFVRMANSGGALSPNIQTMWSQIKYYVPDASAKARIDMTIDSIIKGRIHTNLTQAPQPPAPTRR